MADDRYIEVVHLPNVLLRQNVTGRALGDDPSVFDHDDMIGKLHGQIRIMQCHENSQSLFADNFSHLTQNQDLVSEIQMRCRFIEN